MTKVPLEGAALEKLREVNKRVEICDPEGRIVGYFEPSIYAGQVIPPEPTEEELAEAEEGEGYTLAEVLAYLKTLEKK
ncbi:MAG TPA: hypothetical protein VM529_09765 [Gemmata sp.]|jgi:hypothetical protein|nr:hypothetical protein [Gemmata sp.]